MGGKGDDNSNANEQQSMMMQQQQNAQREAAALKQKAAAGEEPVETKTTEEKPVTEAVQQPTEQMGDNLTGLGDTLISGLSEGRMQQVADQQERLKADPKTYATQFDPYTGTYVGQGPYNGSGGQV